MKLSFPLLAALLVLATPGMASATDYTWVGPPCGAPDVCPAGGAWTAAGDWSPSGAPGPGDTVTIAGPGTIGITGAAASGLAGFSLSGADVTDGAITVTSGTVTLGTAALGGEGPMTLSLGAAVTTTLSGSFKIGGSEIDNAGTLNWASGTLACGDSAMIRNSGTWNLTTGTTILGYDSGTSDADIYNTGTLNVLGSATTNDATGYWGLHNTGVIHFTGGGTLELQNAGNTLSTLDDGGSITGNGTLLFDQPTPAASGSNVTLTGTTSIGTGATLAFGVGSQVTVGATGDTLVGPGSLSWTGGHIIGAGNYTTQLPMTWGSTLVVHLTGSAEKDTSTSYIVSNTSVTWDQGEFFTGDSYFTNNGTFTANGDLAIGGSYSTIENHGTFVKQSGTGKLTVNGTTFTNYGTINGASGSIALVTSNNGFANLLEGGSTLKGSVVAYTEVSLAGASTVATASTLEIGQDAMNDVGLLDGSGSLGGPGTVKLDGSNVTATGMSTITFAAGGNVLFTPNGMNTTTFSIDPTAALTFAGTTTWSGGELEIGTGLVTNSGAWTTTAPGLFTLNLSGSALTNTGTFTANPGSGVVELDMVVTSSGSFVAKSGTLLFAGYATPNFIQTAGSTTLSGGTLASNDGAMPPGQYFGIDIQGGTLTGSGTLDTVVTNEGTVAPGSASAAGTLSITQTYTQSAAGTLAVGLGGTDAGTQFDVLAVTGDVTISGNLNVSRLGGYVPSVGASYTVVTSAGADPDTGMFATTNPPAGVTLTTTYGTNDVVLGVTAVSIPDAGSADAGSADAGNPDAGSSDGGAADARSSDGGAVDAGKKSDSGTNKGSGTADASADDGGSGSTGSSSGCAVSARGQETAPGSDGVFAVLLGMMVVSAQKLARKKAHRQASGKGRPGFPSR